MPVPKWDEAVPSHPQPRHSEADLHGGAVHEQLRSLVTRTGGIAHDLNNMIGTILGYGTLILDTMPADDPDRAFLERMLEAGVEAKQLIGMLLDDGDAKDR